MRFNKYLPLETRRFAMAYHGWDDEPIDDAAAPIYALIMIDDGSPSTEECPSDKY